MLFSIILIVIASALGAWYFIFISRANPPLPMGTVMIENANFTVEIASTMVQQARGLSFRPSLPENHGMLFVFGSSTIQNFWMKDTNFPLDIIWIGGDTVLGFAENTQPQPGDPLWKLKVYSSPDGVNRVLEVNAGTVAKYNIKVGDVAHISI